MTSDRLQEIRARLCDECLWDVREDDHDDTPLPEARRD